MVDAEHKYNWQGKMQVSYAVTCYECNADLHCLGNTRSEAAADARQHDWSLGRDKRWRCQACRPRRFGERIDEYEDRARCQDVAAE